MPESTDAFAERLCAFIADEVALGDERVEPATELLLTGLVDSLGVVIVSGSMQDELDIEIDPVDIVLDNFQTVAQMVAYAERRGALAAS